MYKTRQINKTEKKMKIRFLAGSEMLSWYAPSKSQDGFPIDQQSFSDVEDL